MTGAARRLGLMLSTFAGFLVAVAGLCWLVNPYDVWRAAAGAVGPRLWRAQRAEAVAITEPDERVVRSYRLRLVQPSTLLVGSSRVRLGMPVDHRLHRHVFNAALSGASLAEIDALVRLAQDNPRLERVIWGLELYAFAEKYAGFRYPEMEARLQIDGFWSMAQQAKDTLLSLRALDDSWKTLRRARRAAPASRAPVPAPWPSDTIRETFQYAPVDGLAGLPDALVARQLPPLVEIYEGYQLSPGQLALAQHTVTRLRQAGVAVVLFVPPLPDCELEVIRRLGLWPIFQSWKRQLLAAVGPYRDFSGYTGVERNERLFDDAYHFKSSVGHVILRQLLAQDCADCGDVARAITASGTWVDAETIDAHLARQETRAAHAAAPASRCAILVQHVFPHPTSAAAAAASWTAGGRP